MFVCESKRDVHTLAVLCDVECCVHLIFCLLLLVCVMLALGMSLCRVAIFKCHSVAMCRTCLFPFFSVFFSDLNSLPLASQKFSDKLKIPFLESSAKNGTNVDAAFLTLAKELIKIKYEYLPMPLSSSITFASTVLRHLSVHILCTSSCLPFVPFNYLM